ncbi:uncharacterized protein [Magallana gigas]|uniref:uncharacterized protein isoform X1 n=1 Tax=Magallana gigas TaxID=29159 RepID=UPI00333FCD6B
MSVLQITVFASLILVSLELNMCPESISTVSVVSHCPSNAMEWSSAARRKSCNDIGKVQTCTTKSDTFAYHCVLNKEATMLLELCAPVHFMNGYCARFSEVDTRIINDPRLDCTKFDPPCPSRFPSNESYKYQMCYKTAGENVEAHSRFDLQKNESTPIISIVLLAIFACISMILVMIVLLGYKIGWIHFNFPQRNKKDSGVTFTIYIRKCPHKRMKTKTRKKTTQIYHLLN